MATENKTKIHSVHYNYVGTDEQFRSAMHAWLKTFRRAESEEPKNLEQFTAADPDAGVQTRLSTADENRTEGADIACVPLTRLSGKVEDNDVVETAAEDPNGFAPAETAGRRAVVY